MKRLLAATLRGILYESPARGYHDTLEYLKERGYDSTHLWERVRQVNPDTWVQLALYLRLRDVLEDGPQVYGVLRDYFRSEGLSEAILAHTLQEGLRENLIELRTYDMVTHLPSNGSRTYGKFQWQDTPNVGRVHMPKGKMMRGMGTFKGAKRFEQENANGCTEVVE